MQLLFAFAFLSTHRRQKLTSTQPSTQVSPQLGFSLTFHLTFNFSPEKSSILSRTISVTSSDHCVTASIHASVPRWLLSPFSGPLRTLATQFSAGFPLKTSPTSCTHPLHPPPEHIIISLWGRGRSTPANPMGWRSRTPGLKLSSSTC